MASRGPLTKGELVIMTYHNRRSVEARNCRTLEEVLHVLHGPIRCEILLLLAYGELDVSTITQSLELDMATVSHNLTMLRKRGLVVRRDEHKRRIYHHGSCIDATVTGTRVEVIVTAEDGGNVKLSPSHAPQVKI